MVYTWTPMVLSWGFQRVLVKGSSWCFSKNTKTKLQHPKMVVMILREKHAHNSVSRKNENKKKRGQKLVLIHYPASNPRNTAD